MLNTIKSLSFVLAMPIFLTVCFHANQLGNLKKLERKPAIESKVKEVFSVKNNVKNYLLAVYVK